MPSSSLPWRDFYILRIIEKREICLNTLQKNKSVGHKNILRLQGNISKNYDGVLQGNL